MNAMYDPRVEDVKALYDLYKEVFDTYVMRGSSWVCWQYCMYVSMFKCKLSYTFPLNGCWSIGQSVLRIKIRKDSYLSPKVQFLNIFKTD